MIKIEIKSIFGVVLFKYEKENNTIKDTLIEAVKSGANLYGANLRDANLRDANLRDANLRDANLCDADLYGANLCDADLYGANLYGANLYGANLYGANLRDANLYGANLYGANLRDANLRDANLRCADLRDADLRCADLRDADLRGANLCDADLYGANLCDAKKIPFIPLACPSDGAFIGWKKVHNYLVKLEIPEDARRCSATTTKCRCDKAKVLSITHLETNEAVESVTNDQYAECTYTVGELVYPDSFNEDRWNECSHGIHFFINKQDAINY